ncbi:hypothetical protein [Nocardia africana]|uniref:Uncharacterized protein n=1 Tax=Nocardia africana TaxID=134964 RepID=A0A378WRB6_9NOCA|nr:hypothetical protein [Nocardia africana]MCC3314452.1 hypothetical protein [Nocardia africana]SUA43277.1 Uncharacterised protein [Nocardia africana]
MVNPYQPGYPAPQPPGWGVPPNYPGAQPFSGTRPPGNRSVADIVAGIASAVAAVLGMAQSIWGLISAHGYGFWEYGNGAHLIVFWVCSLTALAGGILLASTGSRYGRVRVIASLGSGAVFIATAQEILTICFVHYTRLSDSGNWLVIPTAVAILAAVVALIVGKPDTPAAPVPGYPGVELHPGATAHPGTHASPPIPAPQPWSAHPGAAAPAYPVAPPAYPAGTPGYPAPAIHAAPESPSPTPTPDGRPSYTGAAAAGYPGAPTPAYPGAPGYPLAPYAAGTPSPHAHQDAAPAGAAGPQPGYASAPEQPGGPDSSSAPTVHAGPSGTPPSEPRLPQQ